MVAKISKKDLPPNMKSAFKNKPYDIYAIRKYLGEHVGYIGYDVYGVGDEKLYKLVRGKDLIEIVVRKYKSKK
jgi:hypothetical protein